MAAGESPPRTKPRPLDVGVKRAYAAAAPEDGVRILVDRLWPRGLSKSQAAIDRWLREVAPSDDLRRWFGHDPTRWDEFRRRYRCELSTQGALLDELRALARQGRVTLVFSARDEVHNQAAALRELLIEEAALRRRADPDPASHR